MAEGSPPPRPPPRPPPPPPPKPQRQGREAQQVESNQNWAQKQAQHDGPETCREITDAFRQLRRWPTALAGRARFERYQTEIERHAEGIDCGSLLRHGLSRPPIAGPSPASCP